MLSSRWNDSVDALAATARPRSGWVGGRPTRHTLLEPFEPPLPMRCVGTAKCPAVVPPRSVLARADFRKSK